MFSSFASRSPTEAPSTT
jgi:hypothetical protein